MSSASTPITPARFRLAIHDLPISNLHAKAGELYNSISHLEISNQQLREFPEDPDCKDAVRENELVIQNMKERVKMLREEVERRGMRWIEDTGGSWEGKPSVNGNGTEPGEGVVNGQGDRYGTTDVPITGRAVAQSQASRRLTDQELRLLLAARMDEPDSDDGEGLHL